MKKKSAASKRAMTEKSVNDGKTKSDTARQNPIGSTQVDRARMVSWRSTKASMQVERDLC